MSNPNEAVSKVLGSFAVSVIGIGVGVAIGALVFSVPVLPLITGSLAIEWGTCIIKQLMDASTLDAFNALGRAQADAEEVQDENDTPFRLGEIS